MRSLLRAILSAHTRNTIRNYLMSLIEPTIAQGWERHARTYKPEVGKCVGDEWGDPEAIGIDVPADQIVSYLDEKVFAPFLGDCEVLLEIGCGGGRFTEILIPKCRRLIAADVAPTMLKLVHERFLHVGHIEYLELDGLGLSPIPDETVDAAFSYDVFVHLQHWDIYNYLVELNRVLKPGGRAIIQHANTFSELGWRKFLADLPQALNRHKLPASFTLMTPETIRESFNVPAWNWLTALPTSSGVTASR